QELAANSHKATLEEVQELTNELVKLKIDVEKKQNEGLPYFRFFTGMKMSGLLQKIKGFEQTLDRLHNQILFDKHIWDLQKRGLILPLSKETCQEAFVANVHEMTALGCAAAFTFTLRDRQQGALELLIYTPKGGCTSFPVSLKTPVDVD